MKKLELFIQQLLPFILLGIGIALVIGMVVVFSYLLLWGIFFGAIIWIGYIVKNILFPPSSPPTKQKGRIIEHDDKN